jgi:Caspase domain
MSPYSDDRAKWALLIGINHYPMFAPRGQLTGCVNDVDAMRQALVESFKFPEDHIAVLTDDQATREGILTAMNELVVRVGKDDIVVFHYSGHGSQMTDVEGDEPDGPDGLDETIVPHDSGRAPYENRDIKDEEIYLWLKDLTEKTSAVTLIFDCCHSGTIVRDDFGAEARWVEPDLRSAEELPPSPIPPGALAFLDGGRDIGPSGWLPLGERYALIAGCSRSERSFEIEESPGVRHGALTYFLVPALREAQPGTTYRDVFEVAAPRVSSRFPDQHPQLEGARDLEIFGVHWIQPMKFVPVLGRSEDTVTLGAGAACGLSEGSQWAVYPLGTKTVQPEEEPLGTVALTSVRAVTSEGRILQECRPGAVDCGMRAVEQIRAVKAKMPVQVVSSRERDWELKELLDDLKQSKLLRPAGGDELARVCIYLLSPRAKIVEGTPVPMLGPLTEETWAVIGENGDLLMPPQRRSRPGVVQILVDNLEKVVRHRLTLDLKNGNSTLTGKVEAELSRYVSGGFVKPELSSGGADVFYEGEHMVLRVVNHHDRPLFIYVLDLGLTGQVQMVYPVAGAEDSLLPGRTLDIGKREGEELIPYIPSDFPLTGSAPEGKEIEGLETLKIFATTHPTDFFPLLQAAFRGTKSLSGPVSSLSDVLSVTFGGGGYRDFRPPTSAVEPEDWTALEIPFRLRRQPAGRIAAGGRSF